MLLMPNSVMSCEAASFTFGFEYIYLPIRVAMTPLPHRLTISFYIFLGKRGSVSRPGLTFSAPWGNARGWQSRWELHSPPPRTKLESQLKYRTITLNSQLETG